MSPEKRNDGKFLNYSLVFYSDSSENYKANISHSSTTNLGTQTINNLVFEKYIFVDMNNSLNYFYKAGSQLYKFSLNPFDSSQSTTNIIKTVDQILSTFKTGTKTLSEEESVRGFIDEYAKAYISGNWTKLKTLLTSTVAKEMTASETSLPLGGFGLTKYEIVSLMKAPAPNYYEATIRFYRGEEPLKNLLADPVILITKENGQWKSISWYLYQ